jgi:hypothetical protein
MELKNRGGYIPDSKMSHPIGLQNQIRWAIFPGFQKNQRAQAQKLRNGKERKNRRKPTGLTAAEPTAHGTAAETAES